MLKQFGIKKGVNFGGWMSQCDYSEDRLQNFITEEDFKKVSEWGFDHVRIPVDYNLFQKEDGSFMEKGFSLLDHAFELCEKYHLKAVLDLHKTAGFSFDKAEGEDGLFTSESYQERFYRLWEEFAGRYGGHPDRIFFELLNEVTDEDYLEAWKRIAAECIRRIRTKAPDTYILIGSYHNNGVAEVEALDAPQDEKVIYNVHCYDPVKYTHQGAAWAADWIDLEDRFTFEEMDVDENYFEKLFSIAVEKAEKNNTGLYCGEYGTIDIIPGEDALKWYQAIHSVFEKYGIARSVWNYKEMDFGLIDKRFDGVREKLIQYL